MTRRVLVTGVMFAATAWLSVDLNACGDKFLRIGRSSRYAGYAPVHHSSILLLVPGSAKPSEVRGFEKTLKKAGHRFHAVRSMDAVSQVLATDKIDIVIVAAKDAPGLEAHVMTTSSRPQILPFVDRANAAMVASAYERFGHVLKLPTDKDEALIEIDNVMEQRVKSPSARANP